jgi:20S proteasome alpha/beta subunit
MSFIITIYVREGIVMAGDSRLTLNSTQQQTGQPLIQLAVGQTDSSYKTFLVPHNIGIATYGAADVQGIPIAGTIESFVHEHLKGKPREIDEVPPLLARYFQQLPGPPDTGFHVAGYKTVGAQRVQRVWQVSGKSGDITLLNEHNNQGAAWGGEADILARLIQPVWLRDAEGDFKPLPSYTIPWQFFTLQDGIDFAVYALRTTIDSIRFQPRPKTVGGPIDVLVIKPDRAFWVQHKELHVS